MTQFPDSYYEAGVSRPPAQPPLAGETRTDVCVIGGGFCGLSCALELARAGKSVVVLEAERAGWGASGRNGGQFIRGYSTDELAKPAAQAGVEEKYLFALSLQAMDLLRSRVKEFNIDCDLRQGHMLAAVRAGHCREIDELADRLLNKYDYPVQVLDAVETREHIASRKYCGGLVDDNSGHLHPLKYLLGLLRAATDAGVVLHENCPALSCTEDNGGATVKTAHGTVKCDQAVLAGNAYLNIAPALRARIMPVGTYIAATAPMEETAAENLIAKRRAVCDMNFVLDYYRCSADHRLLFGGRVSYANREPKDLMSVMRRRMLSVFPQLENARLQYAWGGSVAITVSRFPDIGRRGSAIYYAQGFSGHGVALSGFAGKVLSDAICGDSEKLDVFAKVKHTNFPGGEIMRMPMLVLATAYYRLRDLIG